MKELYKPVFWCGFALSLSALYASSEKQVSRENVAGRKPVLMQIKIGESIPGSIDSQSIASSEMAAGESIVPAPQISEGPIPIEAEPETVPVESPSATPSIFFSAAREVLGKQ